MSVTPTNHCLSRRERSGLGTFDGCVTVGDGILSYIETGSYGFHVGGTGKWSTFKSSPPRCRQIIGVCVCSLDDDVCYLASLLGKIAMCCRDAEGQKRIRVLQNLQNSLMSMNTKQ